MSELNKALAKIQRTLNAPKNQVNKFGGYNYRNCEDILQSLKPIMGDCVLTLDDDIHFVADRVYVKATATIRLGDESLSVNALARESLSKKGMDESQITGAASSYARKYALNGLFMIDDNKDADYSAPSDPDIDMINDAISRNDTQFVIANWDGLIKNKWGQLTGSQTTKLNKIMGSING